MYAPTINHAWLHGATAVLAAVASWVQPLSAGEEDDYEITAKGLVIRGEPTIISQGKHFVEIHVDDGDVKVKVDGEEIPTHRIKQKDGKIVILDRDGNEIKSFGLFLPDDANFEFAFDWPGAEDFAQGWSDWENQPNVMIGIHMGEPGEALRHHLRLEAGETTMITGIYEDLPAHKAGLERFDIIVAVDGRQPADPAAIREALADREPDEEVTLTVIHEGRTQEFEVELEAFDPSRLDSSRLIGGSAQTEIFLPGEGDPLRDWRRYLFDPKTQQYFRRWFDAEQLEDQLSEALRERLPRDLDDRMERLNERIDKLQEMIDKLIEQAQELADEVR